MAENQPQQAKTRLPVPSVAKFKEHPGDPSPDFRQWLVQFDLYLEMIEDNLPPGEQLTDARKKRYLAVQLGAEGLRVFGTNPVMQRRADAGTTYEELRDAARNYFSPRVSIIKAMYDFHRREQERDESVDDYLTALRTLGADCNFAANLERFLMVQLVEGCVDKKTQRDLLAMQDPTLERVLAVMRANETASRESALINPRSAPVNLVNKNHRGRQQQQKSNPGNKPCTACGGTGHQARTPQCPANGRTCSHCNKPNHFQQVCRAKSGNGNPGGYKKGSRNFRSPEAEMKRISTIDGPDDPITLEAWIGNGKEFVPVTLEADSGAKPSAITYTRYREHFSNLPLLKVPAGLRNYDGSPIKGIRGIFRTAVMFAGRKHVGDIHVMDDAAPEIIGKNFLKPLSVKIECGPGRAKCGAIRVEDPVASFPNLLSEKLGTFSGSPHHIKLRPDAVPRAVRLRPIPLARREAAIQEIKAMDEAGIWEEVANSEWAHPMVTVPKPDGGVRITTDLTALNKYVVPERFPLPKIKDLFLELSGAKVFSKLDLRKGYFHVLLDEESKNLTTTITPLGLRRYHRLPMGLTDAASAFQRRIHQSLIGLPGVIAYIDDIIVFGETQEIHDQNLRNVLARLDKDDLRLQFKKCMLSVPSVPAFGHIVSASGVTPDPKNLDAILEVPTPSDMKEVQSFLGLINFYQDFMDDVSTISEPLRKLTRKDVSFEWTEECDMSFRTLKKILSDGVKTHIFDPNEKTLVTTDASDVGIGALLSQIQNGKEVPIAFYNKTLEPPERNYAANEKEALACLKACEHWEKFLLGRPFTLRTDHQALTTLLNNPQGKRQSSKFQRWKERLAEFDYSMEYVPGHENKVADYLSRLQQRAEKMGISKDENIHGIRYDDLKQASKDDALFSRIRTFLQKDWPHGTAVTPDVAPYKHVRKDLRWREGCLQKDKKLVVPSRLRLQILQEAHKGHPGMVRMKRLLRGTYWWPGMDNQINDMVRFCHGCQLSEKSRPAMPQPETKIPTPQKPGIQYAIDICGDYDGHYLVVLIDCYSRYPWILDTKAILLGA